VVVMMLMVIITLMKRLTADLVMLDVKHVQTTKNVLIVVPEELTIHNPIVHVPMVNMKILPTHVNIVHMNVLNVKEAHLLVPNVLMLENLNQVVNAQMDSMILKDNLFVEFVNFNVILVPEMLPHV